MERKEGALCGWFGVFTHEASGKSARKYPTFARLVFPGFLRMNSDFPVARRWQLLESTNWSLAEITNHRRSLWSDNRFLLHGWIGFTKSEGSRHGMAMAPGPLRTHAQVSSPVRNVESHSFTSEENVCSN